MNIEASSTPASPVSQTDRFPMLVPQLDIPGNRLQWQSASVLSAGRPITSRRQLGWIQQGQRRGRVLLTMHLTIQWTTHKTIWFLYCNYQYNMKKYCWPLETILYNVIVLCVVRNMPSETPYCWQYKNRYFCYCYVVHIVLIVSIQSMLLCIVQQYCNGLVCTASCTSI